MILDEMPENVDVDLLKNLYSLTTMSPLQSNQTMQTPQGLAGLPIIRRSEGGEFSEEGDKEAGEEAQEAAAAAAGAGPDGPGPDGAGPDGDNTTTKTEDVSKTKSDVTTVDDPISQLGKGYVGRVEADAGPSAGDFAPTALDTSMVGVEKTGFENLEEELEKIKQERDVFEKKESYNERENVGKKGPGYSELNERAIDLENQITARDLTNQFRAEGFKDLTVTVEKDGTFAFSAPNFGDALGAGLSEIGKGFRGAIDTGADLIGGMFSVTPAGLAKGAMQGTGPGGALADLVSDAAKGVGISISPGARDRTMKAVGAGIDLGSLYSAGREGGLFGVATERARQMGVNQQPSSQRTGFATPAFDIPFIDDLINYFRR